MNNFEIDKELLELPAGKVDIKLHGDGGFGEGLYAETAGRGRIEIYSVMPGIKFSFDKYAADGVTFRHEENRSVLEISHCRRGRIGWNMKGGVSVYFGAGDLCLRTMDCCAESVMLLPTGYYEGVTVSVDMDALEKYRQGMLENIGVDADELKRRLCGGAPAVIPACRETDWVFSVLYRAPEEQRPAYCRLKAQELLMYLSRTEPDRHPYIPQKTELIKEIHDFLIAHPERRFTIEELSKKYLINTSTLKSVFKAVYGMPIAAYMKDYRIRYAMELLRTTDDSIAAVAELVGYETQSKFTKAFKDLVRLRPTEYRKLYRN